jgi:hypothetical protein
MCISIVNIRTEKTTDNHSRGEEKSQLLGGKPDMLFEQEST